MKLSQIENHIKKALIAPNGIEPTSVTVMGPTTVEVAGKNVQKIELSFTIPSFRGVKTVSRSFDETEFSNFFHEKLTDISFSDILKAYQNSQTQPNDVATLRNQAADNDANPQTSLAAAEQSDAPESVTPYQEKTKEVSQHSR